MRKIGLLLMAGGVAVAVAAAAVLMAAGGGSGAGDTTAQSQAQAQTGAAPQKDSAVRAAPQSQTNGNPTFSGQGSGGSATGGAGSGAGLPQPDVVDRKVVRTASIDITVDNVGSAVQQVEDAAQAAGGFVAESSVSTETLPQPANAAQDQPPPKRETATVKIRVPADSYNAVMKQLRGFAKDVKSETSNASEVTQEFTDLQARLRTQQATEQRYLDLLSKAQTIPDILSLQDRLNAVRLDIEQVQGRINLLNDLSDMATITAQISPPAPPETPQTQPGWAQKAWDNAWDTSQDALRTLGAVGITMGVVLLWLVIPATVLLAVWRLLGPKGTRKEAA